MSPLVFFLTAIAADPKPTAEEIATAYADMAAKVAEAREEATAEVEPTEEAEEGVEPVKTPDTASE